MSGTELSAIYEPACGTECYAVCGSELCYSLSCLRYCAMPCCYKHYSFCGTELGYAATNATHFAALSYSFCGTRAARRWKRPSLSPRMPPHVSDRTHVTLHPLIDQIAPFQPRTARG
eukprot:2845468-Rhodomonas_salina.3